MQQEFTVSPVYIDFLELRHASKEIIDELTAKLIEKPLV